MAPHTRFLTVPERGIEPHVPVFDKSKRTDGSFSRQDFTYDHQGDVYVCPAGKMLTCKGTVVNDNQLLYRARKHDCDARCLKFPNVSLTSAADTSREARSRPLSMRPLCSCRSVAWR